MEIGDTIFGFRSRGALFCEGIIWFEEQVHCRRHNQDSRVSSWQYFRGLHRKVFQQIKSIPINTKFAPHLADIFLYSYKAEFIQSLISVARKRLAFHFSFTYIDTLMTYSPLITETLRIISVRCISLWDQRRDEEQHFCFLLWFAPVNR